MGLLLTGLLGLIKRPGIAGAVLQTPVSFIHSLINYLSQSSFVKISSSNLQSQTLKARELKAQKKVHLPTLVTCHMSCVSCHMSQVTFLLWTKL